MLRDASAISLGFFSTSRTWIAFKTDVGTAVGLHALTEDRITERNATDEDGLRNKTRIRARKLDKVQAKGQCKDDFRTLEGRNRNNKAISSVLSMAGGQSECLESAPEVIRAGCDG